MGNVGVDCVDRSRPQAVGFWRVHCTIDYIAPGFARVSHNVDCNEGNRVEESRSGKKWSRWETVERQDRYAGYFSTDTWPP